MVEIHSLITSAVNPSDDAARARIEEYHVVAIPTLQSERLALRPFTVADAPRVEELLSTPEIATTTASITYPYPPGAALGWISTHADDAAEGRGISWALALHDGTVIGTIGLRLTPPHRRGSAGYWLGTEYWNHGYMTEALRAVIAWAFDELGYVRVEAMCLPRNPSSGRVMEKAGMVFEGRLRSYVVKNGISEDLLLYAIVNDTA
jgi:RimJ/RimL family protein N-acetyltransferase